MWGWAFFDAKYLQRAPGRQLTLKIGIGHVFVNAGPMT